MTHTLAVLVTHWIDRGGARHTTEAYAGKECTLTLAGQLELHLPGCLTS